MYKFFAKTQFLGKKILFLPECHSTNDTATDLIHEKPQTEGTTIITANQTKGKGQRGNEWESAPEKNIIFSFILKPSQISISHQFNLHIITTLSIHKVLFPILGKRLSIKWPNDIYYNKKKIGGILIENILRSNKIEYSIIGIGINVNQLNFQNDHATSIKEITSQKYVPNEIIENILVQFEQKYIQFKSLGIDALKKEYLRRLYQFNKRSIYVANNRSFNGIIVGITAIGKLKIQEEEKIYEFDFKEVVFQ